MEGKASRQRFSEAFKVQAVKQVTERGHKVGAVATRWGVSSHEAVCVAQAAPAQSGAACPARWSECRGPSAEGRAQAG